MPTDPEPYDFRPFTAEDMDQMAAWLSEPHIARWWGDAEKELADIAGFMAGGTVRPFVILMDGRPIGYIQSYDIHGEDGHPYRDQPPGTVGIDLSIGETDLVGKGHGPRIIDAFVRRLFAAGATRVVIDPDPANEAAIRAYGKAGFRILGRRNSQYGPALIMARDAPDRKQAP